MIASEKQGGRKRSWLVRALMAPLRALGRARDFYVDKMTRCATGYPLAGAAPFTAAGVPRTFSVARSSASSDDDYRELVRAASQGKLGKLNVDGVPVVPRSQSVAVGRIDEDSPMDFSGDIKLGVAVAFPRSRSCAVPSRTSRVGVVG